MSVPRTDLEIIDDIIDFCEGMEIEPMDGSYKVEAGVCAGYLMTKYGETKKIIICIFINLARDGYIRIIRGESGKAYILLDKDWKV